ncbi:MAG: hypothetical protein IPM61_03185 [Chlorobi bacterium]|nr:hypothetical protein [Chlorobiota bacterium]MBX7218221.1 hypothetical protein [Candidatus Kapabacteria bacterium]
MHNHWIVDTNVLVVANNLPDSHAAPSCIQAAIAFLISLKNNGHLVVDADYAIIKEYINNAKSTGQGGVGDAFLKWVLQNRANSNRCTQVQITHHPDREYKEFPDDPNLISFDRSDRKFVAVALAHPGHPPIVNAVDSDWGNAIDTLGSHGVQVHQLCP